MEGFEKLKKYLSHAHFLALENF